MMLDMACKKAFEGGFSTIKGYNIDGNVINLDCNCGDSTYSARIIFKGTNYHTDSAYDNDDVMLFASAIQKNL
ncbi:hypothetical protein [Butyrivibrio sp. INlla21]|uniref:hypothetical protein n=1 Tax=Butyrivibrio sp. INlla21 TaxID=1520811 RepID=UPI0008EFF45C|nr:hypothetical protein [Butyrivibrio sp. INlla21]SFU31897.1 hypothetical protein SAMN02910342_00054 [Butyrivibrio sp. INlla21]